MRRRSFLPLILCLAAMAVAAPAAAQSIRLAAERTPLDAVLQQLGAQAGLDIVFAERLVAGKAVTGRYVGDDPEEALWVVLRGSGLRAERLRPRQYVIVNAFPTAGLGAETYRGTLTGSVVDAETGEVLPDGELGEVGSEPGALTDRFECP